MNVAVLVGNLASEPELRQTSSGRAVCSFRLAVSRASGEQADFFTIVAWERQAEICRDYLSLGRRVAIEGRMHHSTWEAEDGRRSKVEVIAHRVELLGARPKTADATDATASIDTSGPFEQVAEVTAPDLELAIT